MVSFAKASFLQHDCNTEELSLATDHNDFSFSWAKGRIPKWRRNCLSYKMSYMPLKLSFELYLGLLVLCKVKDLTYIYNPLANILKKILFTGRYQVLSWLLFHCVWRLLPFHSYKKKRLKNQRLTTTLYKTVGKLFLVVIKKKKKSKAKADP